MVRRRRDGSIVKKIWGEQFLIGDDFFCFYSDVSRRKAYNKLSYLIGFVCMTWLRTSQPIFHKPSHNY